MFLMWYRRKIAKEVEEKMLRVRVLDDDGSFTTQDIIEIRNCPLCGKRFMKGRCV